MGLGLRVDQLKSLRWDSVIGDSVLLSLFEVEEESFLRRAERNVFGGLSSVNGASVQLDGFQRNPGAGGNLDLE